MRQSLLGPKQNITEQITTKITVYKPHFKLQMDFLTYFQLLFFHSLKTLIVYGHYHAILS